MKKHRGPAAKVLRAAFLSLDEPSGRPQEPAGQQLAEAQADFRWPRGTDEVMCRQWLKICRKSSKC